MAKRRKEKKIYKYDCSISGETYKLTEKADKPEELMGVQAWYELNPDKDDRPEDIKKRLGLEVEAVTEAVAVAEKK